MKNSYILTNDLNNNHLKNILTFFEDADEIWIATAFLKNSGLILLLPSIKTHLDKGGVLKIIAGKHFGLTEPRALYTLYEFTKLNVDALFLLDNAISATSIFHPKLFVFINKSIAKVITGSANITKGGLVDNEEISTVSEIPISSDIFSALKSYFYTITNNENAENVTLISIKRYEDFYNQQFEARKNEKAVPPKSSQEYDFDYSRLKKWMEKYDLRNFQNQTKQRESDYRQAEKLLDEIASKEMVTQSRFEQIIDFLVGKSGQAGLWKSGSLMRLRFKVYSCKQEFIDLVNFIKKNRKGNAGKTFSDAKYYVNKIKGARMNYVTEIMMTYEPQRFANLNSNPITVLSKEAGVYFKSHSNSFTVEDYEIYCEVIKEICRELNLKNMLEADSFINEIYWELKKTK